MQYASVHLNLPLLRKRCNFFSINFHKNVIFNNFYCFFNSDSGLWTYIVESGHMILEYGNITAGHGEKY